MPVVVPTTSQSEPISDGRFPYGEVITVVNRGVGTVKDAAGNRIRVDDSSVDYIGAFDPAIGFESPNDVDGRVSTQPGVYLPFVAVVTSSSRVLIKTGHYAGNQYEVDGEPEWWKNPHTGWEAGCKVPLRRSTG